MRMKCRASYLAIVVPYCCCLLTVGCNTKEPVVDIETPAGQVEVERDTGTGEVEIEITDNE